MAQQNEVLVGAIRKLASAGERAGFTVEEMIELLNTGVSVETLLNLIYFRLEVSDYLAYQNKGDAVLQHYLKR
jgi:hypothetical protein